MSRAPEPGDECLPGGHCPTCNGEDEPEIEDCCEFCGAEGPDCECPRRGGFEADTREESLGER